MIEKTASKKSYWPQVLILCGVLFLAGLVLVLKRAAAPVVDSKGMAELPQARLDHALAENKPILAFYHSNTCESCLQMIAVVNQVYPKYAGSVVLVDIDVNDTRNDALIKKVGLNYIPTLMFYYPSGRFQTFVGVLGPEDVQHYLSFISGRE